MTRLPHALQGRPECHIVQLGRAQVHANPRLPGPVGISIEQDLGTRIAAQRDGIGDQATPTTRRDTRRAQLHATHVARQRIRQ